MTAEKRTFCKHCRQTVSLQCEYGCDIANVEISWPSKDSVDTGVYFCLG